MPDLPVTVASLDDLTVQELSDPEFARGFIRSAKDLAARAETEGYRQAITDLAAEAKRLDLAGAGVTMKIYEEAGEFLQSKLGEFIEANLRLVADGVEERTANTLIRSQWRRDPGCDLIAYAEGLIQSRQTRNGRMARRGR